MAVLFTFKHHQDALWFYFTCAGLVRLAVSDAVVAVFKARLEGKLVSVRGFW